MRVTRLIGSLSVLALATAAPLKAETYVASASVPAQGLTLDVTIDTTAEQIEFRLTGNLANWFAWGFGSSIMNGTYALICNSDGNQTILEYKLGNHSAGNILIDQSVVMTDVVVNGSVLEVTGTRPTAAASPDHYEFNLTAVQNGDPVPVIWARGLTTDYSFHGGNRGSRTVQFQPDVIAIPEEGEPTVSWGSLKLTFRPAGD